MVAKSVFTPGQLGRASNLDDLKADLAVMQKAFGLNDVSVAAVQSRIGEQFLHQNEYASALNAYRDALRIYCTPMASTLQSSSILKNNDMVSDSSSRNVATEPQASSFVDPLNAAAMLSNIGLILRRIGNYQDAIDSYFKALKIYKDFHMEETADNDTTAASIENQSVRSSFTSSSSSARSMKTWSLSSVSATRELHQPDKIKRSKGSVQVNLELNIVHTLQIMAQVYSKRLNNADAAIECHQEAVAFLMEFDNENGPVTPAAFLKPPTTSEVTGTAKLKTKEPRDCREQSPKSVSMLSFASAERSFRTTCKKEKYHVVKLAEHERVCIIAKSLNALAQLHEPNEQENQYSTTNDASPSNKNVSEDDDALYYYKEALDILRSLRLPESSTSISFLSSKKSKTSASPTASAIDLSKFSAPFVIDLRLNIGSTLMRMGQLYERRGNLNDALLAYREAWTIRHKVYDDNEDQTDVVAAQYSLGLISEKLGRLDEAMSCYKQVLLARNKALGSNSVDVANVLNSMSSVLQRKGNWAESLVLNGEALTIYQTSASEKGKTNEHAKLMKSILGTLYNRGILLMQMKRVDEAIATFEEVGTVLKVTVGSDHLDMACTWTLIGDIYVSKKMFEEAKKYYLDSLNLYKKLGIGENDSSVLSTKNALVEVEHLAQRFCLSENAARVRSARATARAHKKTAFCENNEQKESSENQKEVITLVAKRAFGRDDTVSQITFKESDIISVQSYHESDNWLWGTTQKGHGGWFPAAYVSRAVEKITEVTGDFFSGPLSPHPREKQDVLPPVTEIRCDRDTESGRSHRKGGGKCRHGFPSYVGITSQHQHADCDLPSQLGLELEETSRLDLPSVADLRQVDTELPIAKIKDDCDIDTLLGQINVVTCDMNGAAKPFKEVMQIEKSCRTEPHPTPQGNLKWTSTSTKTMNAKKSKGSDYTEIRACLDLLTHQKEVLGTRHPEVAKTIAGIARLYKQRGENERAIRLYLEVKRIQANKIGDSEELSATLHALADLYVAKGELNEAAKYYSKARDVETVIHGEHSPIVANTLNEMGVIQLQKGDYDTAMEHHQQALSIQQPSLQQNIYNPDVYRTLVHIGAVYCKERDSPTKLGWSKGGEAYENFNKSGMLGKIALAHVERGEYVMAEQFYEELLQKLNHRGDKRSMHTTAATLNSLGSLSVMTGRYVKAMSLHEQALALLNTAHGTTKVDLADTWINIGTVERHASHFRKSLEIFEDVLPILRCKLGADHPNVAKTIYNMGVVHSKLCDYDTAIIHLDYALQIQRSFFHGDHPDTLHTLLRIAIVHANTGKLDAALSQFTEILKCQRQIYRRKHAFVAETIYHIGLVYAGKGELHAAMKSYQETYEMQKELLGFSHPDVATTLCSIGSIYAVKGRHEKALAIYEDVLRIQREVLGEEHVDVAITLNNEGIVYSNMKKYTEAMERYDLAIGIAIRAVGKENPFVADIHINMGDVNLRKCFFDKANDEYNLALRIYETLKVGDAQMKIESTLALIARVQQAEDLFV